MRAEYATANDSERIMTIKLLLLAAAIFLWVREKIRQRL